ncbi:hypothetical protein GCM10022204_41220 [Microlunatus aurantiacus]|uniref:Uncharacterized protein n=2 Tax=Microlunatus aurantiacus TaxID=446786 RepID=A0ABP7EC73_9ACTN
MYSLAVEDELMGLLAAAERLLAVTGDAVTLCPSNHHPAAAGEATLPEPADAIATSR